MSKLGKSMTDVGAAAQSTQQSLKQEVKLTGETVRMGHEMLLAAKVLGGLLAVALVLLIVLETQWIRYWRRKLAESK
ncbi:MAG: hypothetical protein ACHQ2Z_05625 [Elusimicrobiota bacterium]